LYNRGGTLNSPTITVHISALASDVISFKATHWAGSVQSGPNFALENINTSNVSVVKQDKSVTVKNGSLSCKVNTEENKFAIDFLDDNDNRLTGHAFRSVGYMRDQRDNPYSEGLYRGQKGYMTTNLDLGVGELVYGLGERFGPLVKNGQTIDVWNEDGGTSSELAYKNIPFYLTNRNYGVLVRHAGRISLEVQSERTTRINISVEDEALEYIIIYGATPKDILTKYTALTGRPPLPPAWSYGLWLTTSFTTSYDEKTVTSFIDGFKERDIPLSVFHFDCFWMRGFEWCNFEFDADMFPDPKGYLTRLQKKKRQRICVWINSYIAQESALWEEGRQGGYLVKKMDGNVFQMDLWQAGMSLVDFTNPAAWKWYQSYLEKLVDMGVTAFKTDFGERIPFKDIKYHDGSDPSLMHNYYNLLYNKCVQEVLDNKLGKNKGCLFARSATVGGQTMPIHWGGDCESTYEAMAESLRGGLSLGLCGFGYWAHDIGGFEGLPSPDIYKRWVQFGLLSSHSRLHGSSSYRVPWIYDDEACDVLRKFTKLKISLVPYLFACAAEAHEKGTPVLRPLFLEYPKDRNTWALDQQYLLGPNLLVAPVFRKNGEVEFYVPENEEDGNSAWVGLLNGKHYQPGKWYNEKHDFLSLPILVRPDRLVLRNFKILRPEEDFMGEGLEVVYGVMTKDVNVKIMDADGREVNIVSATVGMDGEVNVRESGLQIKARKAGLDV